MPYEHDVFVSFCSEGTVQRWMDTHFLAMLREILTDDFANPDYFKVYCWRENEIGSRWPLNVQKAHANSRLMLAIITPSYFLRSHWCVAEWETMLKREQHCGIRPSESLIMPVLYSDGEMLPNDANLITRADLRSYAYPEPGFSLTDRYPSFRDSVRALVHDIKGRLPRAPAFDAGWPVIDIENVQLHTRHQRLPRL